MKGSCTLSWLSESLSSVRSLSSSCVISLSYRSSSSRRTASTARVRSASCSATIASWQRWENFVKTCTFKLRTPEFRQTTGTFGGVECNFGVQRICCWKMYNSSGVSTPLRVRAFKCRYSFLPVFAMPNSNDMRGSTWDNRKEGNNWLPKWTAITTHQNVHLWAHGCTNGWTLKSMNTFVVDTLKKGLIRVTWW